MRATIAIKEMSREVAVGPGAGHWLAEAEVRLGDEHHETLVAVVQSAGTASFDGFSIILGDNMPDWVCEDALRETATTFFRKQCAEELRLSNGQASEALTIKARILDDYEADLMPWKYFGSTLSEQVPTAS